MSLLLDTHALLWLATEPDRLRPETIAALRVEQIFVSPVSAYEMMFKMTLGKLPVARRLLADLPGYLVR